MNQETFGQRLSRIRKEKGLTQDDIAKRIVISPQAVSKWENDISSPDILVLPSLADILGVSVDELLGRDGTKPKEDAKEESNKKDKKDDNEKTHLHIEDGDSYVHISEDGIHLVDEDDSVIIDKKGIHITDGDGDGDFDDDDHENFYFKKGKNTVEVNNDGVFVNGKKHKNAKITWHYSNIFFPIAIVIYIVLGLVWTQSYMGWKCGWVVFLFAISLDSIFKCIRKKKVSEFSYTFLVTGVYCLLGFLGDEYGFRGWDFYWFLFLTIPVFHALAKGIDHGFRYIEISSKE